MMIAESFIVGLAVRLTQSLLQHVYHRTVGPSEKKALEGAYQKGFEAALCSARNGLSEAELQIIAAVLSDFVSQADVASAVLNLALTGNAPDLDWLSKRFDETGSYARLQNIRFHFNRNFLIFCHSVTTALVLDASQQDSSLTNLVSLSRIVYIQEKLEQIAELARVSPDHANGNHQSVQSPLPVRSATENSATYYSCFISYSEHDDVFAKQLYQDLKYQGVPCWFAPEDMVIGNKIRQTVEEAIGRCDRLLVLLSKHSIHCDWVESEVDRAKELERKDKTLYLFPIRLDNAVTMTEQAWAASIRRQRYIGDFSGWKSPIAYQSALRRLLKDLGKQ